MYNPYTSIACAYCGQQKLYTDENFPVRIYAKCRSCIEKDEAERDASRLCNRIKRWIAAFRRATARTPQTEET